MGKKISSTTIVLYFKKGEKWEFFWPESAILDFTRTHDVLLWKQSISAECPKEHEYQRWGGGGSCKEPTKLVQSKCYGYRKIY